MIQFEGEYFDGKTSRPQHVSIEVGENELFMHTQRCSSSFAQKEIKIDPMVGSANSIIYLPLGQEIHSQDLEAIRALEKHLKQTSPEYVARYFESKLRYVVATFLFTIALLGLGFLYGIPKIAAYVARVVPERIKLKMDEESLFLLDKAYLKESLLPLERQHALAEQLHLFCSTTHCAKYQLFFRSSPLLGANAFALAGESIIVTDQLVEKAEHDAEIVAVLAHELGHINESHTLKMALQAMGSGVLIVMITGDVSTFSDLATGIPLLLIQQGYSREMEDEADAFALQGLLNAKISPHYFAAILQRIDPDANASKTLLSSHPETRRRIQPFLDASRF